MRLLPLLLTYLALTGLSRALAAGGSDLRVECVAGGKPARAAVVWLEGGSVSRPPSREKVVLDQRNLTFSPHVLAVQVGTVVDFPNNDRVFHNVFSFKDGKVFDIGLYPVGAVRRVKFDRAGLSRIYCNIHPNMFAYVMAVDTPLFGTADDSGRLTLRDVPPGTYRYYAWHIGKKVVQGEVVVRPDSQLQVSWP